MAFFNPKTGLPWGAQKAAHRKPKSAHHKAKAITYGGAGTKAPSVNKPSLPAWSNVPQPGSQAGGDGYGKGYGGQGGYGGHHRGVYAGPTYIMSPLDGLSEDEVQDVTVNVVDASDDDEMDDVAPDVTINVVGQPDEVGEE